MNRRTLLTSSFMLLATPSLTAAQTPVASPTEIGPEDSPVDPIARELTDTMLDIRPLDLLEALETSDVTNQHLLDSAGDAEVSARPWADYGDTDLHHSLGGVALTLDDRSLHDVENESLGGFIVFESAEIAYAEFVRRMAPIDSGMSTVAGGVNIWLVESDDIQIGVTRIGFVMIMAILNHNGDVMTGMIEHLNEVAATV